MTICGTPGYMPPEVRNGRYELHHEVYSLGGLLYFMLTGDDPNPQRISQQLKNFHRENADCKNAYELLSRMWEPEAEKRMKLEGIACLSIIIFKLSVSEVRRHQFLQYTSIINNKVISSSNPISCKHRIILADGKCERCQEFIEA